MIKKNWTLSILTYNLHYNTRNIFDSLLIRLKILILQMSVFFLKNLFYFK